MATMFEVIRELDYRVKSTSSDLLSSMAQLESQVSQVTYTTNAIHSDVQSLHSDVSMLQSKMNDLRVRFAAFQDEVGTFIIKQMRANALNVAHHQKQELEALYEKQFSGYRKVRELASGLLNSSDLATVQKATFLQTSEQVLLQLHDYWLAYCMLAFSHWLNDNSREAYIALGHCLQCDRDRTALFFSFVCRQAEKFPSFRNWAIYYIFNQTPHKLNENCIIFIDAYANGLLGFSKNDCIYKKFTEWHKQIAQSSHTSTVHIWSSYANSLYTKYANKETYVIKQFTTLESKCTNFNVFTEPLLWSRASSHIIKHFRDLLQKQSDPDYFDRKLRDIQLHIISERNNQEKELLKKIRRCDLIIAHEGDEKTASIQLGREFAEQPPEILDFSELLCRALDESLTIQTTAAVKVLAVIISKHLIAKNLNIIQKNYRKQVKQRFQIQIEDWSGSTYDGADSQSAVSDFSNFVGEQLKQSKKKNAIEHKDTVSSLNIIRNLALAGAAFSFLLLIIGLVNSDDSLTGTSIFIGFPSIVVFLIFSLLYKNAVNRWQLTDEKLEEEADEKIQRGSKVIDQCWSEVTIYRQMFDKAEVQARELSQFIESLNMQSTNLGIDEAASA
ncbi:MAG: hypothetical protein Q4F00_09330 [bacterium]|nr:hypothetical protein [bacterium]